MRMRTWAPAEATLRIVGLRPEFDARHVLHPHQGVVGHGLHHDVFELLDACQAALRAHRVGEPRPGDGRAWRRPGRPDLRCSGPPVR